MCHVQACAVPMCECALCHGYATSYQEVRLSCGIDELSSSKDKSILQTECLCCGLCRHSSAAECQLRKGSLVILVGCVFNVQCSTLCKAVSWMRYGVKQVVLPCKECSHGCFLGPEYRFLKGTSWCSFRCVSVYFTVLHIDCASTSDASNAKIGDENASLSAPPRIPRPTTINPGCC
ncbi:hypothetical protein ISCGN_000775 [Ixodes scapularis]